MINNTVKTYLLFVFHNFKDNPNLVYEIPRAYEPLISSKYIKFNYGDHSMVCHFESDFPFIKIEEFSHDFLTYENCQFFIMEINKVATNLTTELKLSLFDLNNEHNEMLNIETTPNNDEIILNIINWNSNNTNDYNFLYEFDEKKLDDFNISLKQPKVSSNNILNKVDYILDKIQETGLSSLTETEKQILNEYGKRN
jgi:hypothetical protein